MYVSADTDTSFASDTDKAFNCFVFCSYPRGWANLTLTKALLKSISILSYVLGSLSAENVGYDLGWELLFTSGSQDNTG